MAIQISNAHRGPRPRMTFLSRNTVVKSTQTQPVHSDADFDHLQISFALVVNVPRTIMTPENGTEVWLGAIRSSHSRGTACRMETEPLEGYLLKINWMLEGKYVHQLNTSFLRVRSSSGS